MRLLKYSRTANFNNLGAVGLLAGNIGGGILGGMLAAKGADKRVLAAADKYHPMEEQRYKQYQRTGVLPEYTEEQLQIKNEYDAANRAQGFRTLGGTLAGSIAGTFIGEAVGLGIGRKQRRINRYNRLNML